MKYSIQSDKRVKIYTKINVLTNINFDHDISLDLNHIKIKKNQEYLFSTYLINLKNKSLSSELIKICEQENFINLIILNENKNKIFKKLINLIEKFHFVKGKKIILISEKNFFKKKNYSEFIFFIKIKKIENKKFLKILKKKLLKI